MNDKRKQAGKVKRTTDRKTFCGDSQWDSLTINGMVAPGLALPGRARTAVFGEGPGSSPLGASVGDLNGYDPNLEG